MRSSERLLAPVLPLLLRQLLTSPPPPLPPPARALRRIYVNCKHSYDTPTSTAVTTHFSSPKSYRQSILHDLPETVLFCPYSFSCARQGDQFTSGFVKVNPNSKIPALVDNGAPGGKVRRRWWWLLTCASKALGVVATFCFVLLVCSLIVFGWNYPQCCQTVHRVDSRYHPHLSGVTPRRLFAASVKTSLLSLQTCA